MLSLSQLKVGDTYRIIHFDQTCHRIASFPCVLLGRNPELDAIGDRILIRHIFGGSTEILFLAEIEDILPMWSEGVTVLPVFGESIQFIHDPLEELSVSIEEGGTQTLFVSGIPLISFLKKSGVLKVVAEKYEVRYLYNSPKSNDPPSWKPEVVGTDLISVLPLGTLGYSVHVWADGNVRKLMSATKRGEIPASNMLEDPMVNVAYLLLGQSYRLAKASLVSIEPLVLLDKLRSLS